MSDHDILLILWSIVTTDRATNIESRNHHRWRVPQAAVPSPGLEVVFPSVPRRRDRAEVAFDGEHATFIYTLSVRPEYYGVRSTVTY
jgi:hypothetical protein